MTSPSVSTRRVRALDVGRGVVALAILAAIIGQLETSIRFWTARGDASIPLDLLNFCSFFTIESNLLAMGALAALVVVRLRGALPGRGFQVLLLCATTFMVVTGIVYNTLLRGIELPQGATLGWSNEVLHLVAPLWMLVDWLLSAPRRDVRFRDLWIVAAFPIAWLAYTLVRGPVTLDQATGGSSWYPYPFLDPANHESGYGGVALMSLLVAGIVLLAATTLVAIARAARRRAGLAERAA